MGIFIFLTFISFCSTVGLLLWWGWTKIGPQHGGHHPWGRWTGYAALMTVAAFILAGVTMPTTRSTSKTSALTATKTVKVGVKRLAKAESVSAELDEQANQQSAEAISLAKAQSAQAATTVAAVTAVSGAHQSTNAAEQSAASPAASTSHHNNATKHSSQQAANQVTTGKQDGDIIGNVNSKIYHVPGQAGYHMNAANAVHFTSEAQAQAAGYRKAKR